MVVVLVAQDAFPVNFFDDASGSDSGVLLGKRTVFDDFFDFQPVAFVAVVKEDSQARRFKACAFAVESCACV